MKKILLVAATSLMTQLYAGGDIAPVEVHEPEAVEYEAAESKFYIVAKGLLIRGESVDHGASVLDGDQDYGFGIDFGYRIGNGFAVEYDFSYSSNIPTEIDALGVAVGKVDASYYTSAIDIVYTVEVSETVGVFAKVGYEYEWETISDLNVDSRDDGFVYGAGLEFSINETYKFVAEYEHSTIDSPRGDSIYAGIMYNF